MINVGSVYSKIATKVLGDGHSKSNTHRVLEFNKSSTRFLVEEMQKIWLVENFVVRFDER